MVKATSSSVPPETSMLTLADPRWKGHRLGEIARAREVTCDFLVGDNAFGSTPASLEAYFMHFALAARRHA